MRFLLDGPPTPHQLRGPRIGEVLRFCLDPVAACADGLECKGGFKDADDL